MGLSRHAISQGPVAFLRLTCLVSRLPKLHLTKPGNYRPPGVGFGDRFVIDANKVSSDPSATQTPALGLPAEQLYLALKLKHV